MREVIVIVAAVIGLAAPVNPMRLFQMNGLAELITIKHYWHEWVQRPRAGPGQEAGTCAVA